MGSILLVGLFTAIIGMLSLLLTILRCKIKCQSLQPNEVLQSSVIFMMGTFFENLVCISISMQMLTYYEVLNSADKMSIAFQFIFLVAVAVFIVYVTYFALVVSPKIVMLSKG